MNIKNFLKPLTPPKNFFPAFALVRDCVLVYTYIRIQACESFVMFSRKCFVRAQMRDGFVLHVPRTRFIFFSFFFLLLLLRTANGILSMFFYSLISHVHHVYRKSTRPTVVRSEKKKKQNKKSGYKVVIIISRSGCAHVCRKRFPTGLRTCTVARL